MPTLATIPININHNVVYDQSFATDANFTIATGKLLDLSSTSLTVGVLGGTTRTFTNNGTLTVSGTGTLSMPNANYVDVAAATTNINTGGVMTVGPTGGGARTMPILGALSIGGGTLNVNGSATWNTASVISMASGEINIDPNNGTSAGSATGASLTINAPTTGASPIAGITGGAINLLDPPYVLNAYSLSCSSSGIDPVLNANCTVTLGGGAHANAANVGGFYIETNTGTGTLEIGNLVVNGGMYSASRHMSTRGSGSNYNTKVRNITINSGSEVYIREATLAVVGNMVNNGLVTGNLATWATGGHATGLGFVGDCQYSSTTFLTTFTAHAAGDAVQSLTGTGFFRNTIIDPIPTDQANNSIKQLNIWSNTNGFTLGMPLRVQDHLRINTGSIVTTTDANILSLGTSSGTILSGSLWQASYTTAPTLAGWGTNTWINGPFKRWIPNSTTSGQQGIFPIGTSSKIQMANVVFGVAANAGSLTASFASTSPAGGTTIAAPNCQVGGTDITSISPTGTWTLISSVAQSSGPQYDITLYANGFKRTDGVTDILQADYPALAILKRPHGSNQSSDWACDGTHVATSGTSPVAILKRTALGNGFSEFSVGGTSLALPIELTSFTAKITNSTNTLAWETATEQNVREFVIERSADGKSGWTNIGRQAAIGNSIVPQSYKMQDFAPLAVAYYRLRSVDNDGSFQLSNIVAISREREVFGISATFPVPTTDDVNIQYESLDEADINLRVVDITGRIVSEQKCAAVKGINTCVVSLSELTAGTYFVVIDNGQFVSAPARVVKQ